MRHVTNMTKSRYTLTRTPQITNQMQHNTTHYNILKHTTIFCNTLQYSATHCNTLQYTSTHCHTLQHSATHCTILQQTTATPCNRLQHTRNTLQPINEHPFAWPCNQKQIIKCSCSNTPHHIAPHHTTPYHTTPHCTTQQRTATHYSKPNPVRGLVTN